MKKNRIFSVIVSVMLFVALLAGCGKKQGASADETKTENSQAYITVETEYGNLYYQEQWAEFMKTETKMEDDILKVDFKAEVEGETYDLFQLSIGIQEEDAPGKIKDSEGNERKVGVVLYELEQKSELTDDEMNRLYAMQEDINYVMDHLDGIED